MINNYNFAIPLTVRVADLNYGNHVGHQNFLLYFQEARMAYLAQFGCSELDIKGYGMMITAIQCRYKHELFLGDEIEVYCKVCELKSKRFTMQYLIKKQEMVCATGTTDNVCIDYKAKQIACLPIEFIDDIKRFEKIDLHKNE
jgi:YbgC/YbaW family acyl-CoA thioester hydrolase